MKSLPRLLVVTCLLTAGGCVLVPDFGPESRSIGDSVGKAGSGKPIEVGRSDSAQVVKVLGEPQYRAKRNQAFGYAHTRRIGYWFPFSPGPCGIAGPGSATSHELLLLEFDPSGILQKKSNIGDVDELLAKLGAVEEHRSVTRLQTGAP